MKAADSKLSEVVQAINNRVLEQDIIDTVKKWPMIHFSDHARSIMEEGFLFGESRVSKLDLTRNPSLVDNGDKAPGYNFAFNAVGWSIENDMLDYMIGSPESMRNLGGMYSDTAVLFVGNGIYTRHYDEFNQVILWGEDVSKKSMLIIENKGLQYIDEEPVYDENGNHVESWVISDQKGVSLNREEDYHRFEEAVFTGVVHLAEKGLIHSSAIREMEELYEGIIDDDYFSSLMDELKSNNRSFDVSP